MKGSFVFVVVLFMFVFYLFLFVFVLFCFESPQAQVSTGPVWVLIKGHTEVTRYKQTPGNRELNKARSDESEYVLENGNSFDFERVSRGF